LIVEETCTWLRAHQRLEARRIQDKETEQQHEKQTTHYRVYSTFEVRLATLEGTVAVCLKKLTARLRLTGP
jgi:hypothetical protein